MLEKIDRVLSEKRWSQADLQRAAGLAATRVSKWRAGQGEPTATQALRIAECLGVDVRWLVDDTMTWPPPR